MELKDELQLLVTIVGMFVGPWLAVRSSLKQFRSQKWWERQGEVYGQVLENLAVVKHSVTAKLDYERHPDFMVGPSPLVESQVEPAVAKLIQIAATGPYYLSEEASHALDKFVKEWGMDLGSGKIDELGRST